jgi:hypothetical protein
MVTFIGVSVIAIKVGLNSPEFFNGSSIYTFVNFSSYISVVIRFYFQDVTYIVSELMINAFDSGLVVRVWMAVIVFSKPLVF